MESHSLLMELLNKLRRILRDIIGNPRADVPIKGKGLLPYKEWVGHFKALCMTDQLTYLVEPAHVRYGCIYGIWVISVLNVTSSLLLIKLHQFGFPLEVNERCLHHLDITAWDLRQKMVSLKKICEHIYKKRKI